MVSYEDECVGCPPEIGCIGLFCPYKKVPHFYCDKCKEECDPDDTYDDDGQLLCRDCLIEKHEVSAKHWL